MNILRKVYPLVCPICCILALSLLAGCSSCGPQVDPETFYQTPAGQRAVAQFLEAEGDYISRLSDYWSSLKKAGKLPGFLPEDRGNAGA